MSEISHNTVQANGIRMHYAEAGEGPLVVLCHGFPESWYSWRSQLPALAEAGFRAVAPDMRGYGQTEAPEQIEKYTLLHLVGDMVALVGALGADKAVIVGHDWGGPVAWHSALLRPDRFRAVDRASACPSGRAARRGRRPRCRAPRRAILPALFPGAGRPRPNSSAIPPRRIAHAALWRLRRRAAAKRGRAVGMVSRKGRLSSGRTPPDDPAAVATGRTSPFTPANSPAPVSAAA